MIAIVVPCFNEEEALSESAEQLSGKIQRLVSDGIVSEKSSLLFVDDGSSDNTWKLVKKYHAENPALVRGIKLAANRGHQNALDALAEYGEVNLFLRGIIPTLGYKIGAVYYDRKERRAGTSKYPLGKMLQFAFEGISLFSIKPIRLISLLGAGIFAASLGMIIYFFVRYFSGNTVTGWASITCSIWGIGGLILLSVGVVGEYIGKIYLEVKRRPRYRIAERLAGEEAQEP